MSHSRLARPRRQRRQRQRADRPLGDLAVMLEEIVGKSGCARQPGRAVGFDRQRERADGGLASVSCRRAALAIAFARTAQRRQGPEPRGAPAARGQPCREIAGRLGVAHQADDARAARQQRHQPLERRRMKPDADRGSRAASPAAPPRARRSRATDARSIRPARAARRGCRRRHARTDRRRRAPRSDGRGGAARRSHRTAPATAGRARRRRRASDDARRRTRSRRRQAPFGLPPTARQGHLRRYR